MRTTLSIIIVSSLLLSACDLQATNPITDSRRADELADLLASLVIMKEPIVNEPGMKERIQSEIKKAKEQGDDARTIMDAGMQGPIIPVKENVTGYVLYGDGMLYISSDFASPPGVDLRAYLTTIVDPREGVFPDATALDLGVIDAPYGEQALPVKKVKDPKAYRTFVLYDKTLKRIYAFAQLSHIDVQATPQAIQ